MGMTILICAGAVILFFAGMALAVVFTEEPAGHWKAENKKFDDNPPEWR